MKKGGDPDTDFAGRWLLQSFREGKLGRWTLDGLGRGGEVVDAAREVEEGESEHSVTSVVEGVSLQSTEAATSALVQDTVAAFFVQQASLDLDGTSGHQAKKQVKAAQAQVRDVKRKARAVVQVQGAGPGIASARRRKYRRNAS